LEGKLRKVEKKVSKMIDSDDEVAYVKVKKKIEEKIMACLLI
jgi:hypothetical protein